MKPTALMTILLATGTLAACQSEREIRYAPQLQVAPVGVEGAWIDPNGVVSTFTAGNFSTRTTDTNQELASGTYTNLSPKLVEINMYSVLRKTQSKVNCAMVAVSQLNCTTEAGAQFSLARRS